MDKKNIVLVIPYRGIGDIIFHIPLIRGLYLYYQKRIILIEMILIGFLLITYITRTIQFEIVVIVTVIYLICYCKAIARVLEICRFTYSTCRLHKTTFGMMPTMLKKLFKNLKS